MKRREFIKTTTVGSVFAGTALSACDKTEKIERSGARQDNKVYEWKMVTTWPKNFPGLGTGAEFLAELIGKMSDGRISVKVYGARELVPEFEIFDAVSHGAAELGHGAAYYWKGKLKALQFFSSVPFGLTGQEMNAWLYYGGGMALWQEAYKSFGLVPVASGNTGVQMGGWFNKEVNSLDDLKGLKMRIPGLGGEVLKRAGGTPVNLPGGELFTALQTGAIDATEWVGPYNDLAFGLYKAAKYYYYPGWHEPGTTLECIVNKAAFDTLTEDLKSIVLNACRVANQDMLAEYTARNNDALEVLINEHNVEMRKFPAEVLHKLRSLSHAVVSELAENDPLAKRIYDSYRDFGQKVSKWHDISERAYLNARATGESGSSFFM